MVVGETDNVGGRICEILNEDSDINVVTQAPNGTAATIRLHRAAIDVVILDIGMPKRDGLKVLPKILRIEPDTMVLMVSMLTFSNVKMGMEGLLAGAAEYLPIPVITREKGKRDKETSFRKSILDVVKALGAPRKVSGSSGRPVPSKIERPDKPASTIITRAPRGEIVLRPPSEVRPKVIAFGSSTGGPKALLAVLCDLPASLRQPIIITQHMPPTFTTILAQNIAKYSKRPCAEGKDGERIVDGHIYLAPGGHHMVVESGNGGKIIRLNTDPPVNFCRPAVDPLFSSIANAYGSAVLAVILTGMGSDGCNGGKKIVEAGGTVIAQDEKTCVVWGMPAAVAVAGICSAVIPLDDIRDRFIRIADGIAL